MVEFVQDYGLWIALIGLFVAMHWFGMGCCGGGHRQRPKPDGEGTTDNGQGDAQSSEAGPKSKGGCH